MINPPRRLFLQWHGDANPAETGNLHGDNVSWCRDRVFEYDIEYVRGDSCPALQVMPSANNRSGFRVCVGDSMKWRILYAKPGSPGSVEQ